MINFHNLDNCPLPQLHQMLAEAKRARKIIQDNPQLPLKVVASYQLDGDEIMSIESTLEPDFVILELQAICSLIQDAIDTHAILQ